MMLSEFAKGVREGFPQTRGCYIAVMRNTEGNYDLEVEIDSGTIGGMWSCETDYLVEARIVADRLDADLRALGFVVYPTRVAWEDSESYIGGAV